MCCSEGGEGEAANSTTVRGLGGLVGVLWEVTEVPGFLTRRARAASRTWFGLSRRYMYIDISSSPETNHVEVPDFGGERLFSRSKHIL